MNSIIFIDQPEIKAYSVSSLRCFWHVMKLCGDNSSKIRRLKCLRMSSCLSIGNWFPYLSHLARTTPYWLVPAPPMTDLLRYLLSNKNDSCNEPKQVKDRACGCQYTSTGAWLLHQLDFAFKCIWFTTDTSRSGHRICSYLRLIMKMVEFIVFSRAFQSKVGTSRR